MLTEEYKMSRLRQIRLYCCAIPAGLWTRVENIAVWQRILQDLAIHMRDARRALDTTMTSESDLPATYKKLPVLKYTCHPKTVYIISLLV